MPRVHLEAKRHVVKMNAIVSIVVCSCQSVSYEHRDYILIEFEVFIHIRKCSLYDMPTYRWQANGYVYRMTAYMKVSESPWIIASV